MNEITLQTTTKGLTGVLIECFIWFAVNALLAWKNYFFWMQVEYGTNNDVIILLLWFVLLINTPIALLFLYGFLTHLFFGKTRSLEISKEEEGAYKAKTKYKRWFLYSYEKEQIAHQFSTIDVEQGFFGRLFNTGKLIIHLERYRNIGDPENVELMIRGVENPYERKAEVTDYLPFGSDKVTIKTR